MTKTIFRVTTLCTVLATAGLLAFTGCKKDDESKSNTDKVSDANYKLTAVTIDPAMQVDSVTTTTDLFAYMDDCEKDNLIRFSKDGTMTEDESTLKCDSSADQVSTGTWAFNSDETKMTITFAGDTPKEVNIIKNDGTDFIISLSEEDNGITYTMTRSYRKQ